MVAVVRSVNRSGFQVGIYHDSGEFSLAREGTYDDSTRSRQTDAVRDMFQYGKTIVPESIYQANKAQIDEIMKTNPNIIIAPDNEVSAYVQRGEAINQNIEAEKARIQEQRRQGFKDASATGLQIRERAMLAEKAGTDWNPSFEAVVASNESIRKNLEESGTLSYGVGGKQFSKKEMAEGYAAQLARAKAPTEEPTSTLFNIQDDFKAARTAKWRKTVGDPFAPKGQDDFGNAIKATEPKQAPTFKDDPTGIFTKAAAGTKKGMEFIEEKVKFPRTGQPQADVLIGGAEMAAQGVASLPLVPGAAVSVGKKITEEPTRTPEYLVGGGGIAVEGAAEKPWETGVALGLSLVVPKVMKVGGKAVKGAAKGARGGLERIVGKTSGEAGGGRLVGGKGAPDNYPFDMGGESGITVKRGVKGMEIVEGGVSAIIGASTARAAAPESVLESAFESSKKTAGSTPDIIGVREPHSPVKVTTSTGIDRAMEVSSAISRDMKAKGYDTLVDEEGGVSLRTKTGKEKIVDTEFFNREKVKQKNKFDKLISLGEEEPGILTFSEHPKQGKSMAGVSEYNRLVGESSKKTIGKGKKSITMEGTPKESIMDLDFKPASVEVHNRLVGEPQKRIVMRNKRATLVYKGNQDFGLDFPQLTKEGHNKAAGEKQKTFLTSDKYVNLEDMLLVSPGQRVRLPGARARRSARTKLSHTEVLRQRRGAEPELFDSHSLISDRVQESEKQLLGRIEKPSQKRTHKEVISEKNIFGVHEIITQKPMTGDLLGETVGESLGEMLIQEQKQRQGTRQRTRDRPRTPERNRPRRIKLFPGQDTQRPKPAKAPRKSQEPRFFHTERATPIRDPFGSGGSGFDALLGTSGTSKPRKSRKGEKRIRDDFGGLF